MRIVVGEGLKTLEPHIFLYQEEQKQENHACRFGCRVIFQTESYIPISFVFFLLLSEYLILKKRMAKRS